MNAWLVRILVPHFPVPHFHHARLLDSVQHPSKSLYVVFTSFGACLFTFILTSSINTSLFLSISKHICLLSPIAVERECIFSIPFFLVPNCSLPFPFPLPGSARFYSRSLPSPISYSRPRCHFHISISSHLLLFLCASRNK